jgi:hypothetical protein
MDNDEIKKLIAGSLDPDSDPVQAAKQLNDEILPIDFREGFTDKVIDKIFSTGLKTEREMEFVRSMNFIFYRIAMTGIAAIVILLISIFIAEGSFSLNSFLGLSNANDESIVYLLTGN